MRSIDDHLEQLKRERAELKNLPQRQPQVTTTEEERITLQQETAQRKKSVNNNPFVQNEKVVKIQE